MKRIALTLALSNCTYAVQNHPLATAVGFGLATIGIGTAMALDHHPLAGGTMIGIGISLSAISIPIAVVIDNFNAAQSGPH